MITHTSTRPLGDRGGHCTLPLLLNFLLYLKSSLGSRGERPGSEAGLDFLSPLGYSELDAFRKTDLAPQNPVSYLSWANLQARIQQSGLHKVTAAHTSFVL